MNLTDYLLRDAHCFDCCDRAVEATHIDHGVALCAAHAAEARAHRIGRIVRSTLRRVRASLAA